MNDLFISYSSEDYEKVRSVVESLQTAVGIRVWMDRSRIIGTNDWRAELTNAIHDSKCVLLFVSSTSVASEDVKTEAIIASDFGKPIIFCYLENTELNPTLRYISAGSQALRVIEMDKITEAYQKVTGLNIPEEEIKESSFPYTIEERLAISNIQPYFTCGNGKNSMLSNRVNQYKKGWEISLFNKGDEARNLVISVNDEMRNRIKCEFGCKQVYAKTGIKIFVDKLGTEWSEHQLVNGLLLTYEDKLGNPYSITLRQIVDRDNAS